MKIQILSDLHIEFQDLTLPEHDSDVVILAGDIHIKGRGIEWIKKNIPNKPVIYILGNHEFYGNAYPKHIAKLKASLENEGIFLLENESISLDGISFYGCTLWTDFELFGDPRIAGYHCQQIMNDYKKIRLTPKYSKLRSIDTHIINSKSVKWLKAAVLNDSSSKKVIVTHHATSKLSLPKHRWDNLSSAAYTSNLDSLVGDLNADYWVHGHIHYSADYFIGNTRVLCNPRGYPDQPNSEFRTDFIVDL